MSRLSNQEKKEKVMMLAAIMHGGESAKKAVDRAEELLAEIERRYPDPPEFTDSTDLRG